MIRIIYFTIFLWLNLGCFSQNEQATVYLFHGQGSDYRIFDSLQLPVNFQKIHIKYHSPGNYPDLMEYARDLLSQIDTSTTYYFLGVSLGGMIASSLATFCNPKKVIVVSSAKNSGEIPIRYRFMRFIPVYKAVPAWVFKYASFLVQPLFEPDRKRNKSTFKMMLKNKNAQFLKQATHMIVHWNLENQNKNVLSIHGTNDHTLPYKSGERDFKIENGSHMMMLTSASKINPIIAEIVSAP